MKKYIYSLFLFFTGLQLALAVLSHEESRRYIVFKIIYHISYYYHFWWLCLLVSFVILFYIFTSFFVRKFTRYKPLKLPFLKSPLLIFFLSGLMVFDSWSSTCSWPTGLECKGGLEILFYYFTP